MNVFCITFKRYIFSYIADCSRLYENLFHVFEMPYSSKIKMDIISNKFQYRKKFMIMLKGATSRTTRIN